MVDNYYLFKFKFFLKKMNLFETKTLFIMNTIKWECAQT